MSIFNSTESVFILLIIILLTLFFYSDNKNKNLYLLVVLANLLAIAHTLILTDIYTLINLLFIYLVVYLVTYIFSINRKYFYLSALLFLLLIPIFSLLNIQGLQERAAVLSLLFISTGMVKDILI